MALLKMYIWVGVIVLGLTISIVSFWIMLIASAIIFKDYLHPAVIFCIPWCVFLLFLLESNFSYDANSSAYLYFAIGGLFFISGTAFGNRTIAKEKRLNSLVDVYYPNYFFLKALLVIEFLFTIYTFVSLYSFIRANFTINVFLSYYINKSEFGADGIINYGRNIILAAVLSMIIGYSHVSQNERRKYRNYLIIVVIVYLLLSVTKMTRNGILNSALPIVVAIIIVSKAKNTTVLRWGTFGTFGMLALFSIVSVLKAPYLFEGNNFFDVLAKQISLYGSGGFVAFQKVFDSNSFMHLSGANTFRTFIALFDSVAGTRFAPPLIQKSIFIGNNILTNVYTFYYWYASDFGIVYALFIQLIIGVFHGRIYKQMTEYNLFGIYKYCIFLYPLIMQIFQDQYFSLLSNWIQQLVFGVILLQSNILFSRTTQRKGKLVWYKDY